MDTILGIDPGTLVMGYGVISVEGKVVKLEKMGVLQLSKHKDHGKRLHYIFEKVSALVEIHRPQAVALESPFFGKNVQSMLKLGRAQGVAIAAAMVHGSETIEYAPRKIKQVVTGNGNASKEQVVKMLESLLGFENSAKFLDATDAVAVALCHHYESSSVIPPKIKTSKTAKVKAKDWAQFLEQNPDRIKSAKSTK